MKKILCSCVTVVLLAILVILVIIKIQQQKVTERISVLSKKSEFIIKTICWCFLSFAECNEYKKLTEYPSQYGCMSMLCDEDDGPRTPVYECTRLDPFISGGQDVEDDEYLHMAGE